ncbi:hypothetical protein [Singulisphaera acidiphila]|nr:hypothetical protein [Singulisphaera acidiphila]
MTINWEFWTVIGGGIGVISLGVAIVSNNLGTKSVSRQLGYDKAQIRLLRLDFADDQIGRSLAKPSIYKVPMIGLDDLDDMIRLNPTACIEMMDDQPLESIRIEVSPSPDPLAFVIAVDMSKCITEADSKKTPWAVNRIMSKEYPIVNRPRSGQILAVPIADLLVRHMAQAQVKEVERRHRAHYGKFVIRVYVKLAGSPTWSPDIKQTYCMMHYFWYPKGFPEKECEDFAATFNQSPYLTR